MIKWHKSLSVGVQVIDDDHKKLIDLLNQFLEAIDDGKTLAIHDVFRKLERYTVYHFSREEGLLELCGYEKLAEHKIKHEAICDRLRDYAEEVLWGLDKEKVSKIKEFLLTWLTIHIKGEDFQYRDSMAKLGLD